MGLAQTSLQARLIPTGGALKLHKSHGTGLPVGFETLGTLKGTHALAQSRTKNLRCTGRRRCRHTVKSIELAHQPVNRRAGAAVTQICAVTGWCLPVGRVVAAPE